MQTFPILTAGGAALRALAPARTLRVLAVFPRTVYWEGDGGALVCIGPPGMGAGPLNAIAALPAGLAWPAHGLRPGVQAAVEGGALCVGDLRFDLSAARAWRPALLAGPVAGSHLAAGLARLRAVWAERPRSDGLGPLIPPLAAGSADLPSDLPDAGPLATAAWRSIRALAAWLGGRLGEPPESPPAETEELIGLGPGLTPSGDDCLAGVLIALHVLGAQALARCLGSWVLARAPHRTHRIALGHLVCAAGGEGAEALHETLMAISTPGSADLGRCLEALGRVGHTSGWDALAGVVAAARAITLGTRDPLVSIEPHCLQVG
jgi:hypothetical protein